MNFRHYLYIVLDQGSFSGSQAPAWEPLGQDKSGRLRKPRMAQKLVHPGINIHTTTPEEGQP
ncbi:MAG: hypothetical protein ABFS56_14290 [Pseudomonadota bacterium]